MRLFIVLKAPVDLDGTAEFIGAFTSQIRAKQACVGAGTYDVHEVVVDRAYRSGTTRDVARIVVLAAAQLQK